nr:Gag-Pol polyprotein [Tanacetum cinerariifolium]
MIRDVITVGLTMRILLLYRGEYSQWRERFMNYLEEQTYGEAMINSIQNGSLFIQGLQNDIYSLIDNKKTAKDLWDALKRQMRGSEYGEQDRKAKCGYKKDKCELIYKFLNNLQPEWKQYGTLMRQTKNLMEINVDALYNILKQNQGDVNDALGYKKKAVVVTSDPLALVAEKMNVNKRKEKVVVSSDSDGSGADDFSELKKIIALLAKDFNRRKFYSKPTNNNLRKSSTSQSNNKKQEFVKSNDKKEDKKADEKKRDMSKVKCYNCKKEGHFAKDCKKAKTDGEAMINSIQNGDQPLPVIAQVSLAENAQNAAPTLKDPKFWTAKEKKTRKIDRLDALERQMRGSEYGEQDRKAAILSVVTRKTTQNQGDVNDALGYKKKPVMVTSDPLALVAEKTNVNKRKEKVVVSSDSDGSGADDFSELKKITALLAKAFNRRKFYSKPTNNNLRISSTSQFANKKQEFIKSNEKKEDKKDDEKKRGMSKVKCYNCKKEEHFAKDCKKAKVKDYNYYKTKMLVAKKDSDEQVLLTEDQAWMESKSDESSSSVKETIAEVAYYTSESENEFEFETSEYYDNSTNYGLFVNNDDDQDIFHDAIKSASERFIENHIDSQKDYDKYSALCDNDKQHRKKIDEQEVLFDKMSVELVDLDKHVRDLKNTILEKDFKIFELEEYMCNKDLEIEKCLERLNVCENKIHKMGQTNQTVHMIMHSKDNLYNGQKRIGFENPRYFEKAKDLRPKLYDEKVIGLGYTPMFLTHSDEALEVEKFKRSRENKIKFAYDYRNLNASYVNEKINFEDDYFQEITNLDFEKIDSPFQQTSSLKPYVPNVILEKIIIDLEDEVVSVLEKEKQNLKTIESLKSKGFDSSENVISKSENQSENDCLVVEKECDKEENPKVIAPGMFKLNLDTFSTVRIPKHSDIIWKKKGSSNTSNADLSSLIRNQQTKDFENQNKDLQDKYDVLKNQTTTFDMNNNDLNEQLKVLIEKNDDLLAQTKVLQDQIQVKHVMIDTHVECHEKYAKLEAERYEYMIRYFALCDNDKQHRKKIDQQEVLFDKMNVQLVELDKHVRDLKNTVLEKDFKNFELEECIVHICLWIINSGCSKHMTGNRALLMNFVEKFRGTV